MEKHFSLNELESLENRYRATLINSIGGFKSVSLVGTQNKGNKTNLSIFNSIVHLGANPALIGMIVRPDSVERHTYENIIQTEFYTLNHVNENNYLQAHQTSARYSREVSEFEATGLTAEYKDGFFAPYVKQSNIQIGLVLKEIMELKSNHTILVIGAIQHIYIPFASLSMDGFIDLECAGSITCSGLDSYHTTSKLSRLSYAKPNNFPVKI